MSIQVENITHIYSKGLPNESKALDDVSFSLDDGKILGVIGHTGSGKSTLMQHLNGLLKPNSGKIIVDGVEITSQDVVMKDIRKKVGLVFQYPEYQLFEETIEKDVAYGPKNLDLSEDEIEKRVKEAITLVGLDFEEIKDRSPFELSGGQKRRVAIAGVIAMKPNVLILDEPTAGLDPGAHKEILKMIQNIHKQENNIIIFVSHNMDDVALISDEVLVMDKGQVYMKDTPKKVFAEKEKLIDIGLELPFATDFLCEVNKHNQNKKNISEMNSNIVTMEDLESHIYNYLTREATND